MDSLKEKVKEIEREEIIKDLKECNWVMARAARELGITERMIGYKIKKYEIRKEEKHSVDFKGQREELRQEETIKMQQVIPCETKNLEV